MASKADVARWRALADAATPGTWQIDFDEDEPTRLARQPDADFIAASRKAVPAMADMLTTAAELLARWDEAEGDLEADGNALCWGATCEWLAEWRGWAPDA